MPITTIVNGLITLYSDIPLALNAVSSLFSEKFPNVMSEESKIASGSAKGTKLAET